ncbi:MAG: urea carboxylase [Methylomonas sp.]|jgi:urea carboxylase|uniref:urea carboxylase n=1 Tax=Methylomonas sp. TaxID=418 RepID=UPI0025D42C70|nr:urea carboxylase [Methylomonas sp.]MCK9607400.1 urea carboxylase [Methylomonas sp.]
MFTKVLIANRGAIACRIIRTLKSMGIRSLAIYTEADAGSLHVLQADEAVCIGKALAAETYLDYRKILDIAVLHDVQAIHPGYGFLSESAHFAEACAQQGIVFIGPTPEHMRVFGLKHTARQLAADNQIPLLPGTELIDSLANALTSAERIGYPVMLKSTAGGGGIGMTLCYDRRGLEQTFESVQRLGKNNFGDSGVFLEKYIERARHIEVQVFGDGKGNVVALGERDCSLQRRNQKVVEETPAPNLDDGIRQAIVTTAVRLAKSVNYQSAGTVEFIYDVESADFYFLEVNTRLQVEHGVTEEVTGVDLVEWMIRLASDDASFLADYRHNPNGHSIQVRVYAEDPGKNFQPSSGDLTQVRHADQVRCETWVATGTHVPPFYDPMLAKIIVKGNTRDEAIIHMQTALTQYRFDGIETNLRYLRQIIANDLVQSGSISTRLLNDLVYAAPSIDVLDGGTQSTVQDYPGRVGYWHIGVPPSGPMDDYAFRLGNRLLNNSDDATALELCFSGPTLKFNTDTRIVLTGAPMGATLDGQGISYWQVIRAKAGQILKIGALTNSGVRSYLCVQGGFDVPLYLDSRATFTLGKFGGHAGRALMAGDVLHLAPISADRPASGMIPYGLRPDYCQTRTIRVIYGPHGAPDFFTPEYMDTFFNHEWEVHYNSSRTGVRMIGPKPGWARKDGGEAGLHPSNIHDNAYTIGGIDFTGDMPIILGPDGPSLGGFVCPATVIQADLWKIGQLQPGSKVRFEPVAIADAVALNKAQDDAIASLMAMSQACSAIELPGTPVLAESGDNVSRPSAVYRPCGDRTVLVEYGPQALDLNLRFRVHALMEAIHSLNIPGIVELTPGIRSLQIQYRPEALGLVKLIDLLQQLEHDLPPVKDMVIPTRIVHLPISWDDPSTHLAIEKYMQSVRKEAPWCPSNIEFIRRINGLDSIDQVKEIFFNARYLVLGLGDVYLGAPVATPIDPRHRLVTTKYNPARTWTPENAVGIGGAYLCIYGMEGPGGYQFVGRTLQVWNSHRSTEDFEPGKPWLLRFFDQIQFYPVSADELMRMREDFPRGRFKLKIDYENFSLCDYNRFLSDNATSIEAAKLRQQNAFEAERERWQLSEHAHNEAITVEDEKAELQFADDEQAVVAPVPGCVWSLEVAEGDRVKIGQTLAIVESMKMEIPVTAIDEGRVGRVFCSVGAQLNAGAVMMTLEKGDK